MQKRGFTLIELSIVLVIIGLIVGGILVGRELIALAQIRSVISEMERYSTAANSFRSKYNAMPGDLTTQQATQFVLEPVSRPGVIAGMVSLAHGNSAIETCASGVHDIVGSEGALFWRDLYQAGMITTTFTSAIDDIAVVDSDSIPLYFPISKISTANWAVTSAMNCTGGPMPALRDAGIISANNYSTTNYYFLGSFDLESGLIKASAADADGGARGGLTPVEAYNIDAKLDDGNPFTGKVFSSQNNIFSSAYIMLLDMGAASEDQNVAFCTELAGYADGVATKYNIDRHPDRRVCNLNIRM